MSPQLFTISIDSSETSSDGRLLQNYTTLLNPRTSSQWNDFDDAYITFGGTVDSSGRALQFSTEGTGEAALKRFLGCWAIQVMPEEGIDEVLTLLKDVLEFHRQAIFFGLPEPQPVRRVTGRAISISERPDIVLSE